MNSLPSSACGTSDQVHHRCSAGAEVAGEVSATGGVILDGGLWFVTHHTGPFVEALADAAERVRQAWR